MRGILAGYEAEEIKTIGDEVMIRAADPQTAVRLGIEIVDRLAFHGSPPVRVGMHSGPAIDRDGDWFGSTVNVASRVADVAKPGEVLITEATREQFGQGNGFRFEERGRRYLKHVPELVPVFRAAPADGAESDLEIDPVCRMSVAPERAESARKRRGITYWFCSADCRDRFESDPRRYIALSPGARVARRGFLINVTAFAIVGGAHLVAWAARGFSDPSIGMVLLFIAWAGALAFHYRLVREVL